MTFTELVAEVCDRLNLTSTEALTRVGREINSRYKRVTSSIGLVTSRRTTVQAIATLGVRTLTFTGIEKINAVIDRSSGSDVVLNEVTYDEMIPLSVGTTPRNYAIDTMASGSVTIWMDANPQTAFTLYAVGLDTADTLSGSQVPAFSADFHDTLIFGAVADELRKMEKTALARDAEADFERRLSDLRMFISKSAYLDIYQGKASSSPRATGSGGGGGSVNGATSYTQTGLITFDRDPAAPFAVSSGSAVVPNLIADEAVTAQTADDSDLLEGQNGAFYRNSSNQNAGTLPDARFPATLPAISGANLTNLDASDLASGTVPDARFPATLPAVSGANLTNLDATDLVGQVPSASLGLAALLASANTFASADSTFKAGNSTELFKTSGVINVDSTQAATGANTTNTLLFSYTLPANALNSNGRAVRFTAWGTFAANANSKTIRLVAGGISGTVLIPISTAANGNHWRLEALLIRTGSSTQDFCGHAISVLTATPPVSVSVGTATLTDSSSIDLVVTSQNGSASAGDTTYEGSIIEFLN